MGEDPNLIGDGQDGETLRIADWVDLDCETSDGATRSNRPTIIM